MALQFAILTTQKTALTAIGILSEVKVSKGVERADTYDEVGNVEATTYYGRKTTLTCNMELETPGSIVDVGDSLTVDGVTYKVRETERVEKNDANATYSITAVYNHPS